MKSKDDGLVPDIALCYYSNMENLHHQDSGINSLSDSLMFYPEKNLRTCTFIDGKKQDKVLRRILATKQYEDAPEGAGLAITVLNHKEMGKYATG